MLYKIFNLSFLLLFITKSTVTEPLQEEENFSSRHIIEGKVLLDPFLSQQNWQANTRVHVNGGEFLGFIKEDGAFTIHNVPPGSYIIEILNPQLIFESLRVEINQKGKFRARKVNHIQTSQVIQVPYPLRMKPLGMTKYFQIREQWMITDFLFNPMILMMLLPLLLIMVLPKMMNDPETKKELEQIGNITKFDMPEVSDMMTNFFAGAPTPNQQQNKKVSKTKKRQ